MPVWEGIDRSYPSRGPQAADYFFRVPEKVRPWIAAVDSEGTGLFQTSTSLLRGRKLFLWGMGAGGRRWQGFLAEPGSSYLEIQAGLARTQAEHLPMPPRSEWCWVEAYGRIDVPAEVAHSPDWAHVRSGAESAIAALVPAGFLEREHSRFAPSLTAPPSRVFQSGSGWGALEARRRRKMGLPDPHPASAVFDQTSIGPEQEGWAALLETGRMSARDEESAVRGLEVGRGWRELLEASVTGGGGWLAWYHLGVMRAYDGELDTAAAAFEESLRKRKTAWALRNLALLERFRGKPDRSIALYLEALGERPDLRQLAVECAVALIDGGKSAEWLRLAATLPAAVRDSGRVRLQLGRAWLELGELEKLRDFLADPPEIPDMREGEVSLSDLWFGMQERAEALKTGGKLDEETRRRVRRDHPPPPSIDFRMASDS
jgi:tetratricopeptide (TPR) repeat protein